MTEPTQSTEDQPDRSTGKYLEIEPVNQRRHLKGWIGFLLLFLVAGAALVALFIYFTNSWTLAILLVGFMVMDMALMGWLASARAERKE